MSVVSGRVVCVGLVTCVLVIYLLAGGRTHNAQGDLSKRGAAEAGDWASRDLLARDLPGDIQERVTRVRIVESRHIIHGADTFSQVATRAVTRCDSSLSGGLPSPRCPRVWTVRPAPARGSLHLPDLGGLRGHAEDSCRPRPRGGRHRPSGVWKNRGHGLRVDEG